jgi:hypothetical protein
MAEKETIFSSKIKWKGIFSFKDLYEFTYNWLREETELDLAEKKYKEKIAGDSKNIEIEWQGTRKLTDYFRMDVKVTFNIIALTKIEINQDGRKIKTNKGEVEISVKGTMVRDYEGKFEVSPTKKVWRGIYEKFIIPARIEEYEGKIIKECDTFLQQTKALLDLEGRH